MRPGQKVEPGREMGVAGEGEAKGTLLNRPPAETEARTEALPEDDLARVQFVRKLATRGEEALPLLFSALQDSNDFVRLEGVRSLGRVTRKWPAAPAAAGLLAALKDGNDFVRHEALASLKALPRAVVSEARPASQAAVHGGAFVDCLERVELPPPPEPTLLEPIRCDRCIAAMVSPGFEGYLDDLLTTLAAYGDCPDARVVVFSVNGNDACQRVIAKHGATHVPCRALTTVNAASKGVLYSVAHVVEADKYLCLDTDIFITGSLRPLFDALDALHPQSLLVRRCAPWTKRDVDVHSLARAICRNYAGEASDVAFLTGTQTPDLYFLKANSGVYAGRRPALLALDAAIRSLQPFASAWIDAGRHGRDELIFSLALGSLKTAVEMSSGYNVQLYSQAVSQRRGLDGRPLFFHRGEQARVLHFATSYGRPLIPKFRKLLGLGELSLDGLNEPEDGREREVKDDAGEA